ncbi:increased DNA methylation 1-like [Dioscorea cayenensis subsp. rotundata]|uniref:Increased DNA methylation 1-like n=1 Tax=Dioscorea cayennensis subsp. rotundata TaxID=55577 RepID=A0AB40C2Z4_DIOCR|nr:increased DNA methylation 1-like [Dioscorea cayenensis subsp. rotundata]
MEPLWMQNGSESGNKAMNGKFLVLNIGTNTVGVGNHCTFSKPSDNFYPNPIERFSNQSNPGSAHTCSNSTQKEPSTWPSSNRNRVLKRNKEDHECISQNKKRKIGSSTSRSTRRKLNSATFDKNPSSASSADGNGMHVSESGPPPWHLVSLLHLFGWKVVPRPEFDDHIYMSPGGVSYFSFSKAYEMFLQGTSKYNKDVAFVTPQSSNSSYVPWISIFDSRSVSQPAAITIAAASAATAAPPADSDCRTRGIDKSFAAMEIVKATEPSLISDEASQPASLQGIDARDRTVVVDEWLRNRFSDVFNDKNSNHDMHGDGRLPMVENLSQIGCRQSPIESNLYVSEASGNDLCLNVYGVSNDTMKQMPNTSVVENLVCNTSEAQVAERTACMPECEFMDIMVKNQSNEPSRDCKSPEVRRLSLLAQLDADLMAEASLLNSTKSLVNPITRKDEEKPSDSMLHEKICSSTSQRCRTGETKRMNRRNIGLNEKRQSNVAHSRSRRSSRINGKHVDSDKELNKKVGADDNLSYSHMAVNGVATKDKEEATFNSSYVVTQENRPPGSDGTLISKQTNAEGSENQNVKIHERRESYMLRSTKKVKALMFTRSSASSKGIGEQPSLTEKCHPSSKTKRKAGRGKGVKKKTKSRGCGLTVRRNAKNNHQEVNQCHPKFSILSWLIDSGTLTENEKVVYIKENRRVNAATGLITRGGIWCHCCEEVIPPSEFELHAGSNLHQPWDHIFRMSGKSLMQCLTVAWEKEKKRRKPGHQTLGASDDDDSDDTCGVCADGGHLICCDACPSTFHQDCLMLKALPEGSWYCPYCRCPFCMVAEDGSYVASEVLTLHSCKQCGCKYHQECAWANAIGEMDSVQSSLCGINCQKVAAQLSDIVGITNPIEGGLSWTLLRRLDEEERGICRQISSLQMECNAKLSLALLVLHECFVPLVDQRTGVDKISQAVYNCGSNFNRLNYEGFYTIILEKNGEIITAATLRFHGTHLAEMPFIGTQPSYQRKGMCRHLLKAIELVLYSLNIKKLIIPAIPDLLETWTRSFGFRPLEQSDKDEIRNLSMMVFAGTTLLQKSICNTEETNTRRNICSRGDGVNIREAFEGGRHMRSNIIDTQLSTFSPGLFAILHPEVRTSV